MIEAVLPQVRHWLAGRANTFTLIGVAGAQGSGKSTLVRDLAVRLGAEGLRVATLSLDDLYLTKAERQTLARDIHPLFATRGVPGTHDVPLGLGTIAALARGQVVPLPRFDKGQDDRAPRGDWPVAPADTQVLLLEGWCLGAAPQPEAELVRPVNMLEAAEDPDGTWRRTVNAALAQDYPALWERIDHMVFLAAPDWPVVAEWREQQEAELRQHAPGAMSPEQVTRFIQHYERLTHWMLTELPERAGLTLRLDRQRRVV
ncbi:MAG: kinase [Novosphingobium sp.]|nr:kinase [Novosphingobium sp.]